MSEPQDKPTPRPLQRGWDDQPSSAPPASSPPRRPSPAATDVASPPAKRTDSATFDDTDLSTSLDWPSLDPRDMPWMKEIAPQTAGHVPSPGPRRAEEPATMTEPKQQVVLTHRLTDPRVLKRDLSFGFAAGLACTHQTAV